MNRWTSTLAMILALISGCDMLNLNLPCVLTGGSCPGESGSAKLIRFASEQDLLDYFREQIANPNDSPAMFGGVLGLPAPLGLDFNRGSGDMATAPTQNDAGLTAGSEVAPPGPTFSQTTVQELGVDEADVVKTDGEFLYIISGEVLRIVRINPSTALEQVSQWDLPGFGREMYLYGDRVVVLTDVYGNPVLSPIEPLVPAGAAAGGGGTSTPDGVGLPVPSGPKSVVTILDTSDPTNPAVISETKFDGTLTSSRMIGGTLYLVLANHAYQYFDFVPSFREQVRNPQTLDINTLLPDFERTDADGRKTTGDVLTWQDMQRPTDPDGYGVTSVVSMDIDNGGTFSAEGIVAEPGLVYASTEAMYLTDSRFGFFGARQTTDLYKFAFQNGRAAPVATGTVPGRILNQYSMGEHKGFLRVATTVSPRDFVSGPQNEVSVLEQQGEELVTVGQIVGIASGETIQSARFVGDRGFLVTFRQIDPLLTLDLSDPRNPRTVGELKVPGFSTFIVPMDENHLLTVGQYVPAESPFFGPSGVQLSIFDVSDFANPTLQHNVIIGDQTGASSEALYNPKAFTYFAEAGLVALPISIFEDVPVFFGGGVAVDGRPGMGMGMVATGEVAASEGVVPPETVPGGPTVITDPPPGDGVNPTPPIVRGGFDGLFVYRVSTDTGFTETNRISTRFDEAGFFGGSFTRGVFNGDEVLAVTDIGIRGRAIDGQDAAPFELFLGTPFAGFPFETLFTDAATPARN